MVLTSVIGTWISLWINKISIYLLASKMFKCFSYTDKMHTKRVLTLSCFSRLYRDFCRFCLPLGHFLGNHSVLDILRQEGYEIVHMPPDHKEPVTEWVSRWHNPKLFDMTESGCKWWQNICIILFWRLMLDDSSFVHVISHRLQWKPWDPTRL